MARFSCQAPFSLKPNEWLEWMNEFARFRIATKLHKEEGDVQRDMVLYALGGGGGTTSKQNLSHTDDRSARSRHQVRDTCAQVNEVFYSITKCDTRPLSKSTAANIKSKPTRW